SNMTKFHKSRKRCGSANKAIGIMMALSMSFLFRPTAYAASAAANFDQEWAKLVAAAKQEGTVAVASGGAPSRQYRPVVEVSQKSLESQSKCQLAMPRTLLTACSRNERLANISWMLL